MQSGIHTTRSGRIELCFKSAVGAPSCLVGIIDGEVTEDAPAIFARESISTALTTAGVHSSEFTTAAGSIGMYVDLAVLTSQQRTIILNNLSGPLAYLRPVLEKIGVLS